MVHRSARKRRDMHSAKDFAVFMLWALGLIVFVGTAMFLLSLALS